MYRARQTNGPKRVVPVTASGPPARHGFLLFRSHVEKSPRKPFLLVLLYTPKEPLNLSILILF